MSDVEMETAKAIAVEAVKTHLQSVEKKKFALSVGTAILVVGSIVSGTWICNNTLHDLKDSTARIDSKLTYRVSVNQFRDWALKLERSNRNITPGRDLTVPDLDTSKDAASTANVP